MITLKSKNLLLILSFLYCFNILSYAQTEKEIVLKYKNALQKMATDSSLHSMELKGEFTIQKLSFPASIYFKLPDLLRIEMVFQKLTFLQISNDSLQWEFNPLLEKNLVTRIDKKSSGATKQNSSFDFISYDLLKYKELDYSLKSKGKQKMDSLDVFVLELTKKDKQKAKIFLDSKTFLVHRIEDEKGYRIFGDYSDKDGYVFPRYVLESNPKQQIIARFNQMAFNKALPDSLFKIPHPVSATTTTATELLLTKADNFYKNGQYDSAANSYTRIIQKDEKNFRAFNGRGLSRIELNEYYEAISDFSRACELNPSSPSAYNNLGLAKYYLGDYKGAIKDYNKALEKEPSYGVALKNRGLAYKQDKQFQQAADDFTSVLKLNAEDGNAHCQLGVALAELQKFEEAIKQYNLALKCNYTVAEVYNFKGVSEYKLEKYDSASTNFLRAVQLNSDNMQYLENYGRALYESGDYAAASTQFENYLRRKGDAPEIYNMNGLCKYRDENYKGAIKDFSKSIELNNKEATYYDNRAAAKEMLQDYDGAILDYSKSIRIYPNDANVFYKRGLVKIHSSKKMEGCLDLATANEMKFEPAKEAILKNCN